MARRKAQLPEVRREHESPLGEYRVAAGLSTAELARRAKIPIGTISQLQNGMVTPIYQMGKRKGRWKEGALAIAEVLQVPVEDLFPRYACRLASTADLAPAQVCSISHTTSGADPHDQVEAMDNLIKVLQPLDSKTRESILLVECLGLSLRDAGRVLGISGTRVGQLIYRAKCRAFRERYRGESFTPTTLYKRGMAG